MSDDWLPKAGGAPAAVMYAAGNDLRRTRVIEDPAPDSAVAAPSRMSFASCHG